MVRNDIKKEFGDYQTPGDFAVKVCNLLKDKLKISPAVVIDPTCGVGNFLKAALNVFDNVKEAVGVEINKEYCDKCRERIRDPRFDVTHGNFFSYEVTKHLKDETLFIGNPPWAMNANLKFNLPQKVNFKGLSGTDALTGASNFDICEYIILKLIEGSIGKNVSIAMLCKTSVARNVLLELDRNDVPVDLVRMYTFDSLKVFRINASACLLYIKMSTDDSKYRNCEVYDINYPDHVCETISFKNGRLCSVKEDVPDLEGKCCFEWRQGVKHDCARLMELEKTGESCYRNKNKETVELEDALIYPLIKSSSFKTPVIHDRFKKYVLVTQKKPREETEYIKELAPQTWKYLNDRKTVFDSRKSSIYTGAPAFSMFGVGEYSFAKYKVGVSGFYKKPLFSLLYSEKPVMVDDTSYFLPFDNYADAYTCNLDLTHLDTSNVTDMFSMFRGCSGLTNLDLTHLDTSNVTYMDTMFSGCSGLTDLDLTHLNTSNVTDMNSMFSGCSGLTNLDLTHLNTSNVTDMSYMFDGCSGLTNLDLTSLDTQNVTNMSSMFYDCTVLTTLSIGEKFAFVGSEYNLPSGTWYSSDGTAYTSNGKSCTIPNNKADTYTRR